jgi:hypothetical protein
MVTPSARGRWNPQTAAERASNSPSVVAASTKEGEEHQDDDEHPQQRTHGDASNQRQDDENGHPIAAEQRERRNRGESLTHGLVELQASSRRSERLLGPLQALPVDG